ncbi:MAG: hypothetical protein KA314_12365 [Chloroflexi bacterium]|nr:hypothetical protein [Chloroflexota bacterium]MBP8056630.1 hypothetical protein [Chloroflexota bacterium]
MKRLLNFMMIWILLVLAFGGQVVSLAAAAPTAATGLQLNGTNQYVTFGPAPGLGSTTFTLELWFRRTGPGVTTSTGAGGITNAIPLLTKGRAEADGSSLDMNYFLGLNGTSGVLVADFEDMATGLNHPISGVTAVSLNTWTHAAATYDGTTWRLYLNGNLEATLAVGQTPRSDSLQHAGLGTAFTSAGAAAGFFAGVVDEARVWNIARTQAEIQTGLGQEIVTASGLIGRWAMNEGAGTAVADSSGSNINGTAVNVPTWVAGSPFAVPDALFLGGTNAYATFGNNATLGLAQFTLETWFRRDGAGLTTSTGTGGVTAIPLITKGRGENDNSNVDMNYFLGLTTLGVLTADFEEGAGGASPGLNHPVVGTTPVVNGVWYHAAATYDGTTWWLYLNGNLDGTLVVGQPVRSDSIQHAALGSALTSTGAAAGFFNGALDEVRIWNTARSQAQIQASLNSQITSAQPGLIARWSLNEAAGTAVNGSAGTTVNGTIISTNWYWTGGAPFSINLAPAQPTLIAPPDDATGVSTSPALTVNVSDPEAANTTVTFYVRPRPVVGPDFTFIALPDTQYYVSSLNGGLPAMFDSQTQWIVDNKTALNIAYVAQLGDCVEHGDNGGDPIEWIYADASMSLLEDPLTTMLLDGIPYSIAPGNHDQSPIGDPDGSTAFYNQYFGVARFAGRGYYGGHYGSNNDNHYELFSASGMDFIVINLEYDTSPDAAVLAWADALLTTYSNRRAILVSHWFINTGNPGTFGAQGQATYDALKAHPNFFLMLNGHVPGEGRRSDTFSGNTVHALLADYQGRAGGGNGWLRILRFSPANNTVSVQTYSPWLNQFETDADSQFTLSYDMQPPGSAYQIIGTNNNVVSGANTTVNWPNLTAFTEYEWYVTINDGTNTTTGPIYSFTTGAAPTAIGLSGMLATGLVGNGGWLAAALLGLVFLTLLLYRARRQVVIR